MDDSRSVYRCTFCGQVVYVVHGGAGQLVCCGHPMTRLAAHESEHGAEKHLPVWSTQGGKVHIRVGETEHPMTDKHHIQWIELEAAGMTCRKFMNPDDDPAAVFADMGAGPVTVRACCNVHGLWKREAGRP